MFCSVTAVFASQCYQFSVTGYYFSGDKHFPFPFVTLLSSPPLPLPPSRFTVQPFLILCHCYQILLLVLNYLPSVVFFNLPFFHLSATFPSHFFYFSVFPKQCLPLIVFLILFWLCFLLSLVFFILLLFPLSLAVSHFFSSSSSVFQNYYLSNAFVFLFIYHAFFCLLFPLTHLHPCFLSFSPLLQFLFLRSDVSFLFLYIFYVVSSSLLQT